MANDKKRWVIEIDKARFDKLKSDEKFWQLVALSRAVNALRFVQAALFAHPEDSDSLCLCRSEGYDMRFIRVVPYTNAHRPVIESYRDISTVLRRKLS